MANNASMQLLMQSAGMLQQSLMQQRNYAMQKKRHDIEMQMMETQESERQQKAAAESNAIDIMKSFASPQPETAGSEPMAMEGVSEMAPSTQMPSTAGMSDEAMNSKFMDLAGNLMKAGHTQAGLEMMGKGLPQTQYQREMAALEKQMKHFKLSQERYQTDQEKYKTDQEKYQVDQERYAAEYAPQLLGADVRKKEAEAGRAETLADYQGQQSQADLDYKTAQTGEVGARTKRTEQATQFDAAVHPALFAQETSKADAEASKASQESYKATQEQVQAGYAIPQAQADLDYKTAQTGEVGARTKRTEQGTQFDAALHPSIAAQEAAKAATEASKATEAHIDASYAEPQAQADLGYKTAQTGEVDARTKRVQQGTQFDAAVQPLEEQRARLQAENERLKGQGIVADQAYQAEIHPLNVQKKSLDLAEGRLSVQEKESLLEKLDAERRGELINNDIKGIQKEREGFKLEVDQAKARREPLETKKLMGEIYKQEQDATMNELQRRKVQNQFDKQLRDTQKEGDFVKWMFDKAAKDPKNERLQTAAQLASVGQYGKAASLVHEKAFHPDTPFAAIAEKMGDPVKAFDYIEKTKAHYNAKATSYGSDREALSLQLTGGSYGNATPEQMEQVNDALHQKRVEEKMKEVEHLPQEVQKTVAGINSLVDLGNKFNPASIDAYTGKAQNLIATGKEYLTGGKYMSNDEIAIRTNLADMHDVIKRLRSGAAITGAEEGSILKTMPKMSDDPKVFKQKLIEFQNRMYAIGQDRIKFATMPAGDAAGAMVRPTTMEALNAQPQQPTQQAAPQPAPQAVPAAQAAPQEPGLIEQGIDAVQSYLPSWLGGASAEQPQQPQGQPAPQAEVMPPEQVQQMQTTIKAMKPENQQAFINALTPEQRAALGY